MRSMPVITVEPALQLSGAEVGVSVGLGYPWSVADFKFRTSLGIYNVTDEEYSEGSYALSPARNWLLSTTLSF